MRHIILGLLSVCTVSTPARASSGADALAADTAFAEIDTMIPTRDGARLFTRIFVPKAPHAALPFMFIRTPYGIDGNTSARVEQSYGFMGRNAYIFVFQDIRGKFKSEGQFVMSRPPRLNRTDPKAVDEGTDAYDSIDWLVKRIPNNNGRVGMTGISYPGWLTAMAMLEPHPALKAVSPQASPADMFLGDDFHHQGAFRLAYGFEYATMMESGKNVEQVQFDAYDTYDWYLRLGSLANVQKLLKNRIPTWNDFAAHPNFDAFWKRQAVKPYLTSVTIPTLNVGGWWDQEDFYGPIEIYRELEKHDNSNKNFLVVGPWRHGGWLRDDGASLGNVQFGSGTSKYFQDSLMAPFFAYYLRDEGNLRLAEATVFEAGSNVWKRYDAWPVKNGASPRNLYFGEKGTLSFTPPKNTKSDANDAYVSDPAKPVPYRARPIQATYEPRGSGWYTWLTEDQRFASSRPDVLTYELDVLKEDLAIAGDVSVTLHAATTGTDADWVVKLIDVYPDTGMADLKMNGYQFIVSNDVLRGRFHESFEKPSALVPGKVTQFTVDLHTQAYTFKKGHRVMIQVQSSWFPLIDRNPQTFVPNIFEAKDSDFRAATQRVYRSERYPSHISLPVVERIVP